MTSAKFAARTVQCLHINRVTFKHNKDFIMFIFLLLFNGFITMCNLKSVERGILSTPPSDVQEQKKTNGTAIKIETTNNQ